MVKIGHASQDERGKATNGQVGDQTGKEILTRSWYNRPWNVYLECTDETIAAKAAKIMEEICKDNNYGYDQVDRWTGYNAIIKNGRKVSGAKGEFDCSSLVITCYILAGINMTADGYTANMRNKLLKTGKFKAYTDSKYLTTDAYAKVGGIYLSEGHHVVMSLENASPRKNPYKEPVIKRGDDSENTKWVQYQLTTAGIATDVDGKFGPNTEKNVKAFQKKYGLEETGVVDALTITKLKTV